MIPEHLSPEEKKRLLRSEFRNRRKSLSPEQRCSSDAAIAASLTGDTVWQLPTILLYVSVGSEPDTLPLLRRALREGKRVALPCCGEAGVMSFRLLHAVEELCPGRYGIPEPPPEAEAFSPAPDALCLVPGLAFDRSGGRLGQGGGYYDRFLAVFPGVTAGLCRNVCLTDALPRDRYDRSVQMIVTESGVIRIP